MNALYERKALGLGREGAKAPVIDPAECLRHFDFKDWGMICVRSEIYYEHLSPCRFDDSERRAKAERWHKAGEDIRLLRLTPEQAGVPGIGVPPPVPSRLDWWVTSPSDSQARLDQR